MGKDLKGKNLGKGINQRKDGSYYARITANKKTIGKYFKKYSDAKKWVLEQSYNQQFLGIDLGNQMKLNDWFDHWLKRMKNLKYKTSYGYENYYNNHIRDTIGHIKLADLKPLHCLETLQIMGDNSYAEGTIKKVRSILHDCLESAVDNDLILKNPVTRNVNVKGKNTEDKYIMNKTERVLFAEAAKLSIHYLIFMFILETGLRYGELAGLKWDDIDFANRTISITRAIYLKHNPRRFVEGEPKTKAGIRKIPLTDNAIEILKLQKEKKKNDIVVFENRDYIFTNKNGKISDASVYNESLKYVMREAGLPPISLHSLRHTFATRCIEDGIHPKTLQRIMGHSKLETTMDLYVHVTDEHVVEEFKKLKDFAKIAI